MEFSRQEYWSGLPFPPQGIFPTQGSNPGLPHCRRSPYLLNPQERPSLKALGVPNLGSFGEQPCCHLQTGTRLSRMWLEVPQRGWAVCAQPSTLLASCLGLGLCTHVLQDGDEWESVCSVFFTTMLPCEQILWKCWTGASSCMGRLLGDFAMGVE